MARKREPAKAVAKQRSHNGIWLDHATISASDYDWLADVERLTLWNVAVPDGFLSKLNRLWWLDIRGGTLDDLSIVSGASQLKYLEVNQVRGVSDTSELAKLTSLRYLSLYGLAKVTKLPSLANLSCLQRIQIGQMRSLKSISGLLDCPSLQDLQFIKLVEPSVSDIERIAHHPKHETFAWSHEDVPTRVWKPVLDRIALPASKFDHPEDWFGLVDW